MPLNIGRRKVTDIIKVPEVIYSDYYFNNKRENIAYYTYLKLHRAALHAGAHEPLWPDLQLH